ncbi:MAG: hypothetical protein ACI8T1_004137 [Verrucomicrobiales bacterium]
MLASWLPMNFRAISLATFLLAPFAIGQQHDKSFSMEDFAKIEKIDLHFHMGATDLGLLEKAQEDRFRFLNIVVDSQDPLMLRQKHKTAFILRQGLPDRVAVASAFSMEGWDEPDWVAKTLTHLDETFDKGAVAIKVWKNIGMVHRDKKGSLIMIDDPKFEPIFRHLIEKDIAVVGHLGEPKNCWLPLSEMTVKNDRNYFENNPRYHMHNNPELPSYEDQIAARDRMLAKYPKLRFIGAHLASLEWSVDRLGQFLDRFPNAMADTAARMGQLQYQSNGNLEKVRAFMIKYQDRLVYGTDHSTSPAAPSGDGYASTRKAWLSHWRYFNTADSQTVPELDAPVKGLSLPKGAVEKLYRTNAERLFSKAWK